MGEKKDTQSRKWMITINNPLEKGFTHARIKDELNAVRNVEYWCMCDEIGKRTHTYHTHILFFRSGAIRFSTLQKKFPPGSELTNLRGSLMETRDYIRKEGKYKNTEKEETNLRDTFEESGVVPDERQGQRNDLVMLYDMIKDGKSDYEILEENPSYMLNLEKINRCREILRYEEFKNKRRTDLKVEYWFGPPGTGKTSGVLDMYGDANVFIVSDYSHPWDGYKGQDIVLFDDFDSHRIILNDLLKWLDIYPLELPCRFTNKIACYTKVYFTSNLSPEDQWREDYKWNTTIYDALMRRIHVVRQFYQDGSSFERKTKSDPNDFVTVSPEESVQIEMMYGQ